MNTKQKFSKYLLPSFIVAGIFLSVFLIWQDRNAGQVSGQTEISNISISPSAIGAGSYFTVSVSLNTNRVLLNSVGILLESPSGKTDYSYTLSYSSSTSTWNATALMPSDAAAGTWQVKEIIISDMALNTRTYFYGNDIKTTFTVVADAPTCASFSYSDWSACQGDGTKARTVTSSVPTTCTGGSPLLIDTCSNCTTSSASNNIAASNCTSNYGTWNSTNCTCSCPTGFQLVNSGCLSSSSQAVTCNIFNYSDWSACSSNGTQTRTVTSSYPSGCVKGNPLTKQSCTYVSPDSTPVVTTCTSFTYSAWSACSSNGTQTRTVTSSLPSGCTGGNPESLTQTCTYIAPATCTSFDYSSWSSCGSDGKKTRTVTASYPSGCTGGTTDSLTSTCSNCSTSSTSNSTAAFNCTSNYGTWNSTNCTCSCPTGFNLVGSGCLPITTATCVSFTYSDWSTCSSSGTKTRSIASSLPSGCTGGNPESLTQSCVYTAPTTCSSFGYSAWSACSSNGTQTRTVTASYPSGCTGGTTDSLTQSCVYIAPATCTSFTYSDWSTCSSSGTKTRSITSSLPSGCTGGNPESLTGTCSNCSTSSASNSTAAFNCTNNYGTWNSNNCTCSCPSGFQLVNSGCLPVKTVTTCTSFNYSDWSACSSSGIKTRTLNNSYPSGCTGGNPESLTQSCVYTAPAACKYTYSDWSSCKDGKQTRTILTRLPSGCTDVSASPLEQTCVEEPVKIACQSYTYSDWSSCINGKKTRSIITSLPEGCTEGNPEITNDCSVQDTCTSDTWQCGDWSDCNSSGIQNRTCSMMFDCYSASSSSPDTSRSCIYKTPAEDQTATNTSQVSPASSLPSECVKIGWSSQSDCELYLQQARIVSDCRYKNLTTQDQCREYFLSKYGKPLKCQGMSDSDCNSLINNVLLSDLATPLSSDAKTALQNSSGQTAVIDTQNKTVTVTSAATQTSPAATQEIKVDSPLAATSGNVAVSLLPMTTNSDQQSLSPVAITFDSNKNGIPDDVESRIGTTNVKSLSPTAVASLSGVDQAIIEGKSLEQPKLADITPSTSLTVDNVESAKNNGLKFQGKAAANAVVTLYIYSAMPIVVTVKTDSSGNWVYDLDKSLVDGKHEVYVAVNNDEGKIVEASMPTPFFIAQAKAVSIDSYVSTNIVTATATKSDNMIIFYAVAGFLVILFLVSAILIIREKSY